MDGIIDQVRRMPLAEKRRLAEALRQAIAEELASGGGEPDRCPRCGCPAFVRKGRDAAGRQRWLCRGCGRTLRRRHARAARPLEAARGRVDGVRGLHGRRAAAARDGGQGGGVAVHGVVHEDARLRGDGAPPAAGARGVLRDGRHVLPGVDAGQPLPRLVRPGEARPPEPATTPPAPGSAGRCACCAASARPATASASWPTAPRTGRGWRSSR